MVRKIHRLILLLLLPAPLCVEAKVISYDDKMTWQDAQTYCREHHDDLVTVEDEEDNQEIAKFDGWIGLHLENDEWKWSATGTTATYLPWRPGHEPQFGKYCVFKKKEQLDWRAGDCSYKHKYICSGETMIVVQEKKTWEEALQHCRSLEAVNTSRPATDYQNNRYDLVSLLTTDDHDAAHKMAMEASTHEVWTGLRFLASRWIWVSGEKMQYSNIPECPTAFCCGTLRKNSITSYNTGNCKERRNFLCHLIDLNM